MINSINYFHNLFNDVFRSDDYEGPGPHDANLSLKGIIALAALSKILAVLDRNGISDSVEYYMKSAEKFSNWWVETATENFTMK